MPEYSSSQIRTRVALQALRLFGIELACAGKFTEPVVRGREVSVALGLKAGQRIRNFTEQIRNRRPLLEDPVVDTLHHLYQKAHTRSAPFGGLTSLSASSPHTCSKLIRLL